MMRLQRHHALGAASSPLLRGETPHREFQVPLRALCDGRASSSPLRGEADSRSERVRDEIVKLGARTLTRLRAARGLGLSPRGRGGAWPGIAPSGRSRRLILLDGRASSSPLRGEAESRRDRVRDKIVEDGARTLTRLRATRGLGLSRAKSGVPDFAIMGAEAGNTPLRWGRGELAPHREFQVPLRALCDGGARSSPLRGEAESRRDRVRDKIVEDGARTLTRLRAARGLGLSPPRGRGGAWPGIAPSGRSRRLILLDGRASSSPLRGEAESRSDRVRDKIVEDGARTLTRLRAARGLGLSRAKSGVPDFAIMGAEAGNTPLRWGRGELAPHREFQVPLRALCDGGTPSSPLRGEAESRRDRVRDKIVEDGARTLTRLRAARGLGLSRAKSGVPDFAIMGAEAGNTPLRWGRGGELAAHREFQVPLRALCDGRASSSPLRGEADSRSERVRDEIVNLGARTLTRLRAARGLGLSRAKSGVPDFAIMGAEAGNTPLRWGRGGELAAHREFQVPLRALCDGRASSSPLRGEADSRSERVRDEIVKLGARTLTRLRAAHGLGLSPRGRGGRLPDHRELKLP